MKSWPKKWLLGQVIIWYNLVYLPLFEPNIPVLSIFILTYLYLPLVTYIWLYLGLIYPYLGIFALNCPDFTICAIFTLYMYYSIATAPMCKMLKELDHYAWIYCISKNWGIQKYRNECSLGVNLVIDIFVCIFRYSHLYTIWNQSDHYLWRYCILKIWGIQKFRQRM